MPDFSKPDVFIEEVNAQEPTEGTSAAQLGLVGRTTRGPVNTPTRVRSLSEYERTFGARTSDSLIGTTLEQFYANGGVTAVIVRVVPQGSLKAEVDVDSPTKWTFQAKTAGTWGNDLVVEIRGNVNFLDDSTPEYTKYDILVKEPDPFGLLVASEVFEAVQFETSTAADYAPTVINDSLNGSGLVTLLEGLGGDPAFFTSSDIEDEVFATADGTSTNYTATLDNVNTVIRSTVTITDGSQVITDDGFGNLVGDVDPNGNNRIDYETSSLDVTFASAPSASQALTIDYTFLPTSNSWSLASGSDGVDTITRAEVSHPDNESSRTGIYAFNKLRDIVNIALPDFVGNATVAQDLIDYADARRDRFVLIEPPLDATVPEAIVWVRNSVARNSRKYAVYFPGVKQVNETTGATEDVPVLGVVAGVFARTDANQNVSKAPAGKVDGAVQGAEAPIITLSEEDEVRLFQAGINPIVNTASQGFSVWGAETQLQGATGLQANFRNIGPVRTFIFLQEFLYVRLQDFIFENTGRGLLTRIRGAIEGDFTSFFNAGLFAGNVKSDAFFVVCDETNNTEEDLAAGVVNVDVGIAVNLPAKFVVVRFQQRSTTRL